MKNPSSASKDKPKGNEHMKDKAFADLKDALEGALAFERGERRDLSSTHIQSSRPLKASSVKTAFPGRAQ